jgi:hypothetical protein
MAVSKNFCDVQLGGREREALLALEPYSFTYFEHSRTLLCYGYMQEHCFDDYLHHRLFEVLRQGRYMDQFGTENVGPSFDSGYSKASERRCRQCAGALSKKFYPGIRENENLGSSFLELTLNCTCMFSTSSIWIISYASLVPIHT